MTLRSFRMFSVSL